LHRTHAKSGRQPFAAFQKSFVIIQKICQLLRRKELKVKRNSECSPWLQTGFANSIAFGVKWPRTHKFTILLKGELKKCMNSWWTIS
jgi:hypothetical protein